LEEKKGNNHHYIGESKGWMRKIDDNECSRLFVEWGWTRGSCCLYGLARKSDRDAFEEAV